MFSPSSAESTEIAGVIAPVAVDQRRTEKAERDNDGAMLTLHAKQRHESKDAALAVIVDAHRDGHVLDRRHDDQGPDHKREHA